jgi:hypothetical protein
MLNLRWTPVWGNCDNFVKNNIMASYKDLTKTQTLVSSLSSNNANGGLMATMQELMNDPAFRQMMSGWSPTAGGQTMFGQDIPGQIPGGGVLQGAVQVAGGIADLIASNKRIAGQRGYMEQAQQAQAAFEGDVKSGKYDARVAQAQRDLAQAGMRKSDTTPLQEASAGAMKALSSDPRALAGALTGIQRTEASGRMAMQEQDLQRELAAKGNLANLEQSALDTNTGFRRNLGYEKFQRNIDAERMAKQNIETLMDRRSDAWTDIAGGVLGAAQSAFMPLLDTTSGFKAVGMNEKGSKVQKTPGEFSHKTNPIDIMKDGMKVGEMTGGEYIINPEQADTIEDAFEKIKENQKKGKQPSTQELMMLYKAVRSVFSQPQFQDED